MGDYCRLCMSTIGPDEEVTRIFSRGSKLPKSIKDCLDVQVSQDDVCKFICISCERRVNEYCSFKVEVALGQNFHNKQFKTIIASESAPKIENQAGASKPGNNEFTSSQLPLASAARSRTSSDCGSADTVIIKRENTSNSPGIRRDLSANLADVKSLIPVDTHSAPTTPLSAPSASSGNLSAKYSTESVAQSQKRPMKYTVDPSQNLTPVTRDDCSPRKFVKLIKKGSPNSKMVSPIRVKQVSSLNPKSTPRPPSAKESPQQPGSGSVKGKSIGPTPGFSGASGPSSVSNGPSPKTNNSPLRKEIKTQFIKPSPVSETKRSHHTEASGLSNVSNGLSYSGYHSTGEKAPSCTPPDVKEMVLEINGRSSGGSNVNELRPGPSASQDEGQQNSSNEPKQCQYCQAGFSSKQELKIHLRQHFPKGVGKRGIPCPICKLKLQVYSLPGHIKNKHKKDPDDIGFTDYVEELTGFRPSKRPKAQKGVKKVLFLCNICRTSFKTRIAKNMHMKRYHSSGNAANLGLAASEGGMKMAFSCHICKKSFKNNVALKVHHSKNHSTLPKNKEAGTCDRCRRLLRGRALLRAHKEYCGTDRAVVCPRCAQEFEFEKDLRRHTKEKHPRQRPSLTTDSTAIGNKNSEPCSDLTKICSTSFMNEHVNLSASKDSAAKTSSDNPPSFSGISEPERPAPNSIDATGEGTSNEGTSYVPEFKCKYCYKDFKWNDLLVHLRETHNAVNPEVLAKTMFQWSNEIERTPYRQIVEDEQNRFVNTEE